MTVPRQVGAHPQNARVDRILRVAADLLLRWGYKRVTVEDIAERAEVGKGTVYLHWSSKDDVFVTLLHREVHRLLDELATLIREHPREVMLHRAFRCVFGYVLNRPLLQVFLGGNPELLGRLGTGCPRVRDQLATVVAIYRDYLRVLERHSLLELGPDEAAATYALDATLTGFVSRWHAWYESEHDLAPEAKANAMARTLRRAFEPSTPSSGAVAAASSEVAGLLRSRSEDSRDVLPRL